MNITVKADRGLNDCSIDFIQHMEKELGAALLQCGFARTTTGKTGDSLEFNYRQFAVCGASSDD